MPRRYLFVLLLSLGWFAPVIEFVGAAEPITVELVTVEGPANEPDRHGAGFGAVAYAYRIGKYEVTNAQYAAFLNAVDPDGENKLKLYNENHSRDPRGGVVLNNSPKQAAGTKYILKKDREENPVVFVSVWDAMRFTNWLHNGQGKGDTENGAYTLTAESISGNTVKRNPGARFHLPSENEWYKAAYYDAKSRRYFLYPTRSNTRPLGDVPSSGENAANFHGAKGFAVSGSPMQKNENYLTRVGAYTNNPGPYGTFDQGGNAWEWTDTIIGLIGRGARGGSWSSFDSALAASYRGSELPDIKSAYHGFRIAAPANARK